MKIAVTVFALIPLLSLALTVAVTPKYPNRVWI